MGDDLRPYEKGLSDDEKKFLAEYDDFDSMVGPLRLAAIDAYMYCEGGSTVEALRWKVSDDGNFYHMGASGGGHVVWRRVARPGKHGWGGGQSSRSFDSGKTWQADVSYADTFTDVCSDIDRMMGPWASLPDPASIRSTADSWGRIYTDLAFSDGAPPFGKGSLVANIIGCLQTLQGHDGIMGTDDDAMTGMTVDAFKKYMENLSTAVQGCRDIAYVLGVDVAAQEKLWTGARIDVARIIGRVTEMFDSVAGGTPSGSWDFVSALANVAGALSLFLEGPAAAVTGGISLGLSVFGDAASSGSHSVPAASTYQEVLAEAQGLLKTGYPGGMLNRGIRDQEDGVRLNLLKNWDIVDGASTRGDFDPAPGPIESTSDTIAIDPDGLNDIADRRMPAIAEELSRIAGQVSDAELVFDPVSAHMRSLRSVLTRDAGVGMGATGPTDMFLELSNVLTGLLNELAWEVTTGAENLRAAVEVLDHANAYAVQRLKEISATLAQGYEGQP